LKRRSGTKRRSGAPPERVVFFVDRALGCNLVPAALRDAGYDVEILDDHYDDETKDTDWIPEVAARGWIILTKDKGIRRRHVEREALKAANAYYFCLGSGNWRGEQQAEIVLKHAARMEQLAQTYPAPIIGGMNIGGLLILDLRRIVWVSVKKWSKGRKPKKRL
jgi:hypothetical protein